MRALFLLGCLAVSSAAMASTPPPPPAYVSAAGDIIMSPAVSVSAYRQILAPDLKIEENGKPIGVGPDAWIKYVQAHSQSRSVIGHAGGWAGDAGDLLVLDTFDSVDRTGLPPSALADPRFTSRSTLYRFGVDEKIHRIYVADVASFFIKNTK